MVAEVEPVAFRPTERGNPHPVGTQSASPNLGELRRALSGWLANAGVAEPVRVDTVLATHEAVANAIQHSGTAGSISVRTSLSDRVCTIEVRDSGCWKDGPSDADRGKGLILIRGLVSRVEIEKRQIGTAVRLIQHLSSECCAPEPERERAAGRRASLARAL